MNRTLLTFWLSVLVFVGLGAMCQPSPVNPRPIVDAGPAPSVIADASPAPSVVSDAGPAPVVDAGPVPTVDAGPAPVVDWLECGPEGFAAAAPVKRKLGARLVAHPRAMLATPFVLAAHTIFWDPLNPIPLDQGNVGRCTGYSVCEELSTKPFGLKSTAARGDAIYHEATCSFDSFVGCWPPDDSGSDCESAARAAMKLGLIIDYDVAYTLQDIKSRLMLGPGVLCSNWSTPQYYTDRCGLTHYDRKLIEGGHAYAMVGQNVELGRIAFRNTWGAKYGTRRHGATGYFQQSYDDVQKELDDGGIAVFVRVP